MDEHYDVYNNRTNEVSNIFGQRKDAELWIAEQENPSDYEIISVEVQECSSPMNLFLDSANLTRNKK